MSDIYMDEPTIETYLECSMCGDIPPKLRNNKHVRRIFRANRGKICEKCYRRVYRVLTRGKKHRGTKEMISAEQYRRINAIRKRRVLDRIRKAKKRIENTRVAIKKMERDLRLLDVDEDMYQYITENKVEDELSAIGEKLEGESDCDEHVY